MLKLSNGISIVLGHISINGEMVKNPNAICALEYIFFPRKIVLEKTIVGEIFVFPGQNPRGHVTGDGTWSFCSPGQLLTTFDTLLGRKLSREMSWDKLALMILR